MGEVVVRPRFSIAELVRRTGTHPATIHHYRRLGLLPPPKRVASNRFLYDERHVQALRLIRSLRDRRALSLTVIRRVLPDLMALGDEEAFRPDMWDEAVGRRKGRRPPPAARLMSAAMDAFARRGFADVNVDEICRAAGIAKGSFYRHHRSKEDLFFAAVEAAAEEAIQAFDRAMAEGAPAGGAAEALGRAIEPRVTIFLELLTKASQRRPGYGTVARRVLGSLARRVGERVDAEEPSAAGAAVIGSAVSRALDSLMAGPSRAPDLTSVRERPHAVV
jgi:AcrR family transcriptional regulator